MNRKEKMDYILAQVPEEKKEEFVAELRGAETKADKKAVLEKYGIVITKEDVKEITKDVNELSEDEMDIASGGGCCLGCGCK